MKEIILRLDRLRVDSETSNRILEDFSKNDSFESGDYLKMLSDLGEKDLKNLCILLYKSVEECIKSHLHSPETTEQNTMIDEKYLA